MKGVVDNTLSRKTPIVVALIPRVNLILENLKVSKICTLNHKRYGGNTRKKMCGGYLKASELRAKPGSQLHILIQAAKDPPQRNSPFSEKKEQE